MATLSVNNNSNDPNEEKFINGVVNEIVNDPQSDDVVNHLIEAQKKPKKKKKKKKKKKPFGIEVTNETGGSMTGDALFEHHQSMKGLNAAKENAMKANERKKKLNSKNPQFRPKLAEPLKTLYAVDKKISPTENLFKQQMGNKPQPEQIPQQ